MKKRKKTIIDDCYHQYQHTTLSICGEGYVQETTPYLPTEDARISIYQRLVCHLSFYLHPHNTLIKIANLPTVKKTECRILSKISSDEYSSVRIRKKKDAYRLIYHYHRVPIDTSAKENY
jgi:hypothetical protein